MINKIKLIPLLFLFILPLAVAEVQTFGTFKQGQAIELLQLCGNCSYSNITLITYPNSTAILTNGNMTKIGTKFNFTLSGARTTATGKYIVNGVANPNGLDTIWSYDFDVTPSGKTLKTGEGGINIWISISVFLVAGLFIFGALLTPKGLLKLIMFALGGIFALAGVMINVLLVQSYVSTNVELSSGYGSMFYLLAVLTVVFMIIGILFVLLKTLEHFRNLTRFAED